MAEHSNIEYLKRVERGARFRKRYQKPTHAAPAYVPPRPVDVLDSKAYLFASEEEKRQIRVERMSSKLTRFF